MTLDRSQRPYACCRDEANLRREDIAADKFIEHCACGRRHHVITVDPATLGFRASSVGSGVQPPIWKVC